MIKKLKINSKINHACRLASKRAGFTLIELLIYMAVFAIAVGLLSGILVTFTRVQGRESASAEVTQQLAFVQTTIQRLVREAVNIENQPGFFSSTLTLRMASPSSDPTIISSDADGIYLKQGLTGAVNPLTNNQVKVADFQVVKYENPGGHAIVQLDFSLTYNSQRVYQQITRGLKTSIGRVTAATFDDSLLPNTPNSFIIGNSTYPWKSLTLSELLNLGQLTVDPVSAQNGSIYYNSVDNAFRGYKNNAWADLGVGWAASAANIYNTNSGNVGIGTTEPTKRLEVQGLGTDGIRLRRAAVTQDTELTFSNESPADKWFVHFDGSLPEDLFIYPYISTQDLILQANETGTIFGNVGIGTTNPGQKLTVTGTIESTSGGIKFPDGTTQTTAAAPAATLKTYDSGWFAIADNSAYTKTHNLGTSKVLISLYGATDASGSNMNLLGDIREYGGGFNGVTVSNIAINSVDVRVATNTSAPQTRIWNGSSWVYPTYARIVVLALE